jgi:hypothetical protein
MVLMSYLMNRLLRCFLFTVIINFLFSNPIFAQVESDERPLEVSQNGISFQKDSVFLMNLRFRMQNRFGYLSALDGNTNGGFEAMVRRLRLRFDGYVLNKKIGYYFQLSFSRNDQELASGTIAQTIRDAMVYYTFNKNFYLGFGQSKLPGNRQRVISSGNLQFPDRSIANAHFTLDRDFGFFAYKTIPIGEKQVLQVKTTISSGEGRGQIASNTGLAYTGRVEWLPLGRFKNLGDYSEGDIEFEKTPKLSVGATYSFNDMTTRSGGQLGSVLPNPVDMKTFIADMMFKYAGWGVMGEFFKRNVDDFALTGSNDLVMNKIPRGTGFNVQLSRMMGKKHEVAARYAGVTPPDEFKDFQYRWRTKAVGYTYYLNKHRIKFQYYFGLDDRYNPGNVPGLLHNLENRINTMIQVELGI